MDDDKFKIVSKTGVEVMRNLSFAEAFQYRLDNIDKLDTFDVKPQFTRSKERQDRKNSELDSETLKENLKQDFIKTLSGAQYSDLYNGQKELIFKGGKWGLKKAAGVKREEIHISIEPMRLQRQTELINKFKIILRQEKEVLQDMFFTTFDASKYTDEEFEAIWDKIMKLS